MSWRRVSVAVLSVVAAGCAGRTTLPEASQTLASPARFDGDFFLRQEIVARYVGRSITFKAALEKRADVLRLVGLTPFGSPAFMIEQSGDEVHFKEYVHLGIPFDPVNMLVDVHHILFEGSGIGARLGDGIHEFKSAGGSIFETWEDGNIVSRTFFDTDSTTELSRIEFQGARDPTSITSPLVRLYDRTHSYEIEIKTVEQRLLGSAGPRKSAAGN
jgi:hypothetical protein